MANQTIFRPLHRCCCCKYLGPRENEPIFLAVYKNNLTELRSLLKSGKCANVKSERGHTLLNYAIERNKVEIFDYLLSLDGLDIDCVDSSGRTPLLYTIAEAFVEYFALQLIKKGANIHWRDNDGYTALHLGARRLCDDNIKVGQLLIKKGADVNSRNRSGETPLYIASLEANIEWVDMLLYYGALGTIPSLRGILPVAVIPPYLVDTLFGHTFDNDNNTVPLSTLVAAMKLHDPQLFNKILQLTTDVRYNIRDLQYLSENLISVNPQHLKSFVAKFSNVTKDIIIQLSPLDMILTIALNRTVSSLRDILYIFLDSHVALEFVQSSSPQCPTLAHMVQIFNTTDMFLEEEKIIELVSLMLTYGLAVTSEDLNAVYHYYGYNRLFKILLHMDIHLLSTISGNGAIACIFYDMDLNLEDFFNKYPSKPLLSYYNHPKLKDVCWDKSGGLLNLPSVPSLIELSRNVARKYIIDRYNIKNARWFYTILNWLPIAKVYKNIIALENKLYLI